MSACSADSSGRALVGSATTSSRCNWPSPMPGIGSSSDWTSGISDSISAIAAAAPSPVWLRSRRAFSCIPIGMRMTLRVFATNRSIAILIHGVA